jgi:hypothetical protein
MTYRVTHIVASTGVRTWPAPDPSLPEGPPLAPAFDVQVLEWNGIWAKIACSNGWEAWVDGSLLVPVPPAVTAPVPPPPPA